MEGSSDMPDHAKLLRTLGTETSCLTIGVAMKGDETATMNYPLTDSGDHTKRHAAIPFSDQAALEVALSLKNDLGAKVLCCSVGSIQVRSMLSSTLALGADQAVLIMSPSGLSNVEIAANLAATLVNCSFVFCGSSGNDALTPAVPGLLAAMLEAQQALGVSTITVSSGSTTAEANSQEHQTEDSDAPDRPPSLLVERKFARGKRELLRLTPRGVISVDPYAAKLRRASLDAALARSEAEVVVRPTVSLPTQWQSMVLHPIGSSPYRPRTKLLQGPDQSLPVQERIAVLLTGGNPARRAEPLYLDPKSAAQLLLETISAWDRSERR